MVPRSIAGSLPMPRILYSGGSAQVYPQHCQLLNLTPLQHLRALTDKLADETVVASQTPQVRKIIKQLQSNITNILHPSIAYNEEQRVKAVERERQQRVVDDSPIITIPQISNAPAILKARDPTAKRNLKNTPCLHHRVTRNNTPGAVPAITRVE